MFHIACNVNFLILRIFMKQNGSVGVRKKFSWGPDPLFIPQTWQWFSKKRMINDQLIFFMTFDLC